MFFTRKMWLFLIYEEEKINYISTFEIQGQEMTNPLFFNDGLNYIKVHIFIYIAAVCLL